MTHQRHYKRYAYKRYAHMWYSYHGRILWQIDLTIKKLKWLNISLRAQTVLVRSCGYTLLSFPQCIHISALKLFIFYNRLAEAIVKFCVSWTFLDKTYHFEWRHLSIGWCVFDLEFESPLHQSASTYIFLKRPNRTKNLQRKVNIWSIVKRCYKLYY